MSTPFVTPVIRAEAARLGVDLSAVAGTGAGGRICLADVRAAAGPRPRPVRAEAPARRTPVEVPSRFDPGVTVTIDLYGPNPLVEDLRQMSPMAYRMAVADGPPPTLFADSEMPPFTASGIEPRELLKVPWHARHALAATPDRARVLRALEHFAHDPADIFGEYEHNGQHDYVQRMKLWAKGDGHALHAVYDTSIKTPSTGYSNGGYKASVKSNAQYAPKRR